MTEKKSYRVYYVVPTSFGHDKQSIKIFNSFSQANTYALTLVKDLKKSAKETDDDESVVIENVNTGSIDRAWLNEGEGRVAYYAGGF